MGKHHVGNGEINYHGNEAPGHPLEEGYMDVAHGIQETQHDKVRRSANGGQHAADGAGIGSHQHESGGVLVLVEMDFPAIGSKHFFN